MMALLHCRGADAARAHGQAARLSQAGLHPGRGEPRFPLLAIHVADSIDFARALHEPDGDSVHPDYPAATCFWREQHDALQGGAGLAQIGGRQHGLDLRAQGAHPGHGESASEQRARWT